MMRNTVTIMLAALLALAGCKDSKPKPKPRTYIALLGKKSDAVIEHLKSTCPGRAFLTGNSLGCFLPDLPGYVHYSVFFDQRDRIVSLEITGTLADARPIYDRAFAPIVPDEVREVLRQSLITPVHDSIFAKPGGEVKMLATVKELTEGRSDLITWAVVDVDLIHFDGVRPGFGVSGGEPAHGSGQR